MAPASMAPDRPIKKPRLSPTSPSSSPIPDPKSNTEPEPEPDTTFAILEQSNTLRPAASTATTHTAAGELTSAQPDAHISSQTALSFWSSQTPDINGVLCGLSQLSKPDLQGSFDFLNALRRAPGSVWPKHRRFPRVVDCGAGVGRITLGLLSKVADVVDFVEPVEKFTQAIGKGEAWEAVVARGGVGRIYTVGLEDWGGPEDGERYGLVWNQWCLSQLTDDALVRYLRRSREWLLPGGWIVVKENISADPEGRDLFDPRDSSVRRTDEKFQKIFREAGCVMVKSRLQRGFSSGILPVRMYALQPKA